MVVEIILISLIVILITAIVLILVLNNESARKKRIYDVIQGQNKQKKNALSSKDEQDRRRAEIAKKLKDAKGNEANANKKKVTLTLMLAQAGLSISVVQYWLFSFALMFAAVFAAYIFGLSPFVVLMVAITALLGIPKMVIKKLAKGRQKKFLEEFPDALEAMVRLLRAGMPVSEAVSMIAREFTGPVGEEMSIIYDKQKIGVPLHEAAYECTHRMPLTEMQMFATGLAIQAQTGSSLSEVLQNLSNVIRARFRLKRKVKALSSEAIASASIIGSLPILLSLGMYFANREYIAILFDTTMGNILLAGAVFMMSAGIFVMRVMINFKI